MMPFAARGFISYDVITQPSHYSQIILNSRVCLHVLFLKLFRNNERMPTVKRSDAFKFKITPKMQLMLFYGVYD